MIAVFAISKDNIIDIFTLSSPFCTSSIGPLRMKLDRRGDPPVLYQNISYTVYQVIGYTSELMLASGRTGGKSPTPLQIDLSDVSMAVLDQPDTLPARWDFSAWTRC
jgi:hypothetical protein